jgi:hypothetical protein
MNDFTLSDEVALNATLFIQRAVKPRHLWRGGCQSSKYHSITSIDSLTDQQTFV